MNAGYPSPTGRRQWSAFTLVELLTVISIIALLMAPALPMPARAKEHARGNVGFLDGSASWKKMADMKIYRGSHLHGQAAALQPGSVSMS